MKVPVLIQKWLIEECGWPAYLKEVALLTRGRVDVQIKCPAPGVIMLLEVRQIEMNSI